MVIHYTVMPFVLTNAHATFQEMMDTIVEDKEGCAWYMYDILIYGGTTDAEHHAFVEQVLHNASCMG